MIESEDQAKAWLRALPEADPVAIERLERLVALLAEENTRQNLVSAASLAEVWRRHIVDSAQLHECAHGASVLIAGLVTVRQRPGSANGTIFLLLEDELGFVNAIVSPQLAERYVDVVKFAPFIVIQGRVERDGAVVNVIGRRFKELRVSERLTHDVHNFH